MSLEWNRDGVMHNESDDDDDDELVRGVMSRWKFSNLCDWTRAD